MTEHKFKLGQIVYFHSRSQSFGPPGPYQIIKQLPLGTVSFSIR
jgi:hypothetical protein